MSGTEKLERLSELIKEINELDVEQLGHFCFGLGNKVEAVFLTGGMRSLPKGKVEIVSFEERERAVTGWWYPWKARVVKDGIVYEALVDEEEAWALYVA